jgi:cation diffusion facilitator family transporter
LLGGFGGIKVDEHAHGHSQGGGCNHDHGHHHHEETNINIRAAVVHVIGDMLQSIGVIIAALLIYLWPEARLADPICTYLFSILVIITTVPVFKDCMRIMMESQPKEVNNRELKEKLMTIS